MQTPDGMIFPDRATLYVTAIEDRQYKDYKIHCEWTAQPLLVFLIWIRAMEVVYEQCADPFFYSHQLC